MVTSFTLDSLAYSLLELLRGSIKDSEDIDIREIYHYIDTQRSLWINKTIDDKGVYPFQQDCGVLELELVDSIVDDATLVSLGYDTNHTLLRTIKNIPKPIFKGGIPLITRIGSIDRHILDFHIVTFGRSKLVGNGRFNKKAYFAYYLNDKVYIKSKAPEAGALKYINIMGVFEKPTSLVDYSTATGRKCYNPEDPYPISADLIDYMMGEIIKTRLNIMNLAPNDVKNDNLQNLQSPQDGQTK